MLFKDDAYAIGQAIQRGELTSEAVTEQTLANIEQLNPHLNAVIASYPQSALKQAKRLDQALGRMSSQERETLSAFYGVPLLLKDIGQYWRGTVTASGSGLLINQVAQETDTSIQMASQAGMVFVGRSNIPEFGLKTVSDSKYFGPVKNPVNLEYNPGGSSGGAAAAVKSGMVPLATGSDAGGSIRVPASDTGLIGLKPSRGRIAEGPGFYRPVNGLATNLLMAKSVRDVFYYLKELQADQVTSMNRLPLITSAHLDKINRPLKIAYTRQEPRDRQAHPDASAALDLAIQILSDLGHDLQEVHLAIDGNQVLEAYYTVMTLETGKIIHHIKKQGYEINFDQVDPLTWVTYRMAPNLSAFSLSDFNAYQDLLVEYMENFYLNYDILLTPTTNGPAIRNCDLAYPTDLLQAIHEMGNLSAKDQWQVTKQAFDYTYLRTSYSQLMNITGQPALSLPIYQNQEGLPQGIQLASKRGGEYILLQLAQQIEEAGHLHSQIVDPLI
ncbi:amidase family protein [Hutsoniella sourekii]|uniref:amidase family protein n=1 Tax=Hutsoniella sourekii TaxID=87650 RepID=UPI000485D337|nr:amidase family protein [Hutsoniella sourekii]